MYFCAYLLHALVFSVGSASSGASTLEAKLHHDHCRSCATNPWLAGTCWHAAEMFANLPAAAQAPLMMRGRRASREYILTIRCTWRKYVGVCQVPAYAQRMYGCMHVAARAVSTVACKV
jgi:hypothetical protein